MPEVTPLEAAVNMARKADENAQPGAAYEDIIVPMVRSWHAFLDHVAETWGIDPAQSAANVLNQGIDAIRRNAYEDAKADLDARLVGDITAAVQLLPRVESLEVRADLAQALGHKLEITPEEPDPGRDWSRVEAHLFKPTGKWMYRIWLDYSTLRSAPHATGCGPSGWYFAGGAMAEQALAIATDNGTSGVTIRELGTYWHLFVPHPPQGFPIWVRPALAENETQLTFDHWQDARSRLEVAEGKLAALRKLVDDYGGGADIPDSVILEVLDR